MNILFIHIAGTLAPPVLKLHLGPVQSPKVELAKTFYYDRLCGLAQPSELIIIDHAGLCHLDEAYEAVEEQVNHKMSLYPGFQAIIFGQSAGALHALPYGQKYPDKVLMAVGLAGPFLGSPFGNFLWPFAGARCLAIGSRSLQKNLMQIRTAAAEQADAGPRLVFVAGTHDVLVRTNSALPDVPGAEHYTVPTGHLGIVRHRSALALIRQLVRPYPGETAAPTAA